MPYCLSYFFKKKYDGELFGIYDLTNKPKKFFKEQNLVDFSKNWFLHDNIKIHKNPDLKYLKNFQNKFNIDLSELVRNDRIFNHYNELYEFSQEQINSILENECKLFEMILDEANPDYFITGETALRPHHLFYEMCKSKGVKILMFNHANWKNFCYISESRHKIDNFEDISSNHDYDINFEKEFND